MAASIGSGGLSRALAQVATPVTTTPIGEEPVQDGLAVEVIELFDGLPGTKALKIWAPPDAGRPAWSAAFDADRELVIASAFKTFVLAEYLRQAEGNTGSHGCRSACRATGRATAGGAGPR